MKQGKTKSVFGPFIKSREAVFAGASISLSITDAMPKRIRIEALKSNDASWKKRREDFSDRDDETDAHPLPLEENDPCLMNLEERQEWRQKIRDVIRTHPNIQEDVGPVEFPEIMDIILHQGKSVHQA